jgi:hypothetical protein
VCVYYTTSNGECNFAILSKIRGEYRNVSNQFLNFDVGRTECVGQTMFSVMTPVSKKIPCKIKMCMKDVQAGVF